VPKIVFQASSQTTSNQAIPRIADLFNLSEHVRKYPEKIATGMT
jgi:hypothetical protein